MAKFGRPSLGKDGGGWIGPEKGDIIQPNQLVEGGVAGAREPAFPAEEDTLGCTAFPEGEEDTLGCTAFPEGEEDTLGCTAFPEGEEDTLGCTAFPEGEEDPLDGVAFPEGEDLLGPAFPPLGFAAGATEVVDPQVPFLLSLSDQSRRSTRPPDKEDDELDDEEDEEPKVEELEPLGGVWRDSAGVVATAGTERTSIIEHLIEKLNYAFAKRELRRDLVREALFTL